VTPGQLLFLTNEKTKKEVVCQVVKSKNYSSVSGYVELEFTEPAVGFWGMRFPSDRVAPPASGASTPSTTPKPAATATQTISSAPQSLPVQAPSPVVAGPANTTAIPAARTEPSSPVSQQVASLMSPTSADSASEELKKQAARLQEQLSSMHFSET